MSSRSEKLLQSWKGAQPILKYRKRYQIPILFGFAFTVYISFFGGLATGNIILACMGIFAAGIYAFLFITMTNVIRSRSKQEKQLRIKQERMKEIIDAVTEYDADRNNVRLQDLKTKIVKYIEDLPNEVKEDSIDPTKVYLAIDKAEEALQQVRGLKTLQEEDRKNINDIIQETIRELKIHHIARDKAERERDTKAEENRIFRAEISLLQEIIKNMPKTYQGVIDDLGKKLAELQKKVDEYERK